MIILPQHMAFGIVPPHGSFCRSHIASLQVEKQASTDSWLSRSNQITHSLAFSLSGLYDLNTIKQANGSGECSSWLTDVFADGVSASALFYKAVDWGPAHDEKYGGERCRFCTPRNHQMSCCGSPVFLGRRLVIRPSLEPANAQQQQTDKQHRAKKIVLHFVTASNIPFSIFPHFTWLFIF